MEYQGRLRILCSGGNVIDAPIGAALVQTAVDPFMCGIAGFGSMHIHLPERGVHGFIDFHGKASAASAGRMRAAAGASSARGVQELSKPVETRRIVHEKRLLLRRREMRNHARNRRHQQVVALDP